MRATSDSQPGPLFVHRAAAAEPWTTLQTKRVGNDIYEAELAGLGDYALAFKAKDAPSISAPGSAPKTGVSPPVFAVIGLLVVSVVAGAVLAARRRGNAT
jgi:LPXTG-motif cell wall-anchored protein